MSSLEVTRDNYWQQIETLVKVSLQESIEIKYNFSEILFANIENHEYTRDTGKSLLCLYYSKNDDYYHDNLGFEFDKNSNFAEKVRVIITYAIWADCIEYCDRLGILSEKRSNCLSHNSVVTSNSYTR